MVARRWRPKADARRAATIRGVTTLKLSPHAFTTAPALCDVSVSAQVRWTPRGDLQLDYRLQTKALSAWRIPTAQPPGPCDGLWQHTCFEAFVGHADTSAYHEFNFSPSGQWAHFAFAAERVRVPLPAPQHVAPELRTTQDPSGTWLGLDATVPSVALPRASGPLLLGLSMVLESADGTLSYWALKHPCTVPDFHHPLGRCVSLPRPSPHDGHHEVWP